FWTTSSLDFDCVENEKHVVSRTSFNDWFFVLDDAELYTYTFLCEVAQTGAATTVVPVTDSPQCPGGYNLMSSGTCIRPLNLWVKGTLNDLLSQMTAQCQKDGGHLPFIRSAQDNAMFIDIVKSFDAIKDKSVFLVLGMVCNPITRRLEWSDNSPITYIQPYFTPASFNFDCIENEKHVVSRTYFNDWFFVPDDTDLYMYTFLCEITPADANCGDYDVLSYAADLEKPCFKLFTTPLSWDSAQKQCEADSGALATIKSADENSFFRRSAVSNGITFGMHIGAHQPTKDITKWTWVDGEVPIEGASYDNFMDPYPMQGSGQCSEMLIAATSGFWMNVDCNTMALPFVCRRSASASVSKTRS
ncbi:hypothetical protein PENTCL1PPCAC_20249, partial [Pristionchus entomophagus]